MSVAELYNKQLNCAAIFVDHGTILPQFVIQYQTLPIVMVDFLEGGEIGLLFLIVSDSSIVCRSPFNRQIVGDDIL